MRRSALSPRTPPSAARSFVFLASEKDIYLRFQADGERYAIPVAEVSEICEPETLRSVPGAFFPIAGIMDLRGRMVTLMDLFHALPTSEGGALALPPAIILREPYDHVGIFVPGLVDTFTLNGGETVKSLEEDARPTRPWITGTLEHEGRLHNVLSGERVCFFARGRLIQTFKQ